DLGQPAQQAALTGQLQPFGAGPLGQLADQVRIRPGHPGRYLLVRHVRHSVSSFLRSYTVEITVPTSPLSGRDVRAWQGEFRAWRGEFRAWQGKFGAWQGDVRAWQGDVRAWQGDVRA